MQFVCLLQKHLASVLEKEEKISVLGREELIEIPVVSPATQIVLKGLFMVLLFLFKDNSRSVQIYSLSYVVVFNSAALPNCLFHLCDTSVVVSGF